jgi:hypothetical protein
MVANMLAKMARYPQFAALPMYNEAVVGEQRFVQHRKAAQRAGIHYSRLQC